MFSEKPEYKTLRETLEEINNKPSEFMTEEMIELANYTATKTKGKTLEEKRNIMNTVLSLVEDLTAKNVNEFVEFVRRAESSL